jgi:two-component system, sensor histidine kinase
MADSLTPPRAGDPRLWAFLEVLEHLVTGDYTKRVRISDQHDVVDALGHGVNVLAGEVDLLTKRLTRALDDAHRAGDEKGRQLRTLSHELRTPLASILALLDLADRPNAPAAERQALLARARANAQLMVRLADDLLDMSGIEAGILRLEPEPCFPADIARDVIESLRPEAQRKGVELEVGGSCEELMLDPARFRQVLTNLISNAVKYTERGWVVAALSRASDQLLVDVRDTGIGIAPDAQASLFVPARRPPSNGGPGGAVGHGLGLSIARRIVEAMGGSIALVDSASGRGSTFRASFPAVAAPGRTLRSTPSTKKVHLTGVRVLLGEDDLDLGATMADLLAVAGAEVAWEKDGRSVCARAGNEPFDLLVLDLGLPHLDGIEVIRRLRAAGNTTPAAALTADAFPETRARCLAAGFNAHVAKGLAPWALCEHLAKLTATVRTSSDP